MFPLLPPPPPPPAAAPPAALRLLLEDPPAPPVGPLALPVPPALSGGAPAVVEADVSLATKLKSMSEKFRSELRLDGGGGVEATESG